MLHYAPIAPSTAVQQEGLATRLGKMSSSRHQSAQAANQSHPRLEPCLQHDETQIPKAPR